MGRGAKKLSVEEGRLQAQNSHSREEHVVSVGKITISMNKVKKNALPREETVKAIWDASGSSMYSSLIPGPAHIESPQKGCSPIVPVGCVTLMTWERILRTRQQEILPRGELVFHSGDARFFHCALRAAQGLDVLEKESADVRQEYVELAFADIMDKQWHWYLYPCQMWLATCSPDDQLKMNNVETIGKVGEPYTLRTLLMRHMVASEGYCSSPYCVTPIDILWLCHCIQALYSHACSRELPAKYD